MVRVHNFAKHLVISPEVFPSVPKLLSQSKLHGSHVSVSPMVITAYCAPFGSLSSNVTQCSQLPSDRKCKIFLLILEALYFSMTITFERGIKNNGSSAYFISAKQSPYCRGWTEQSTGVQPAAFHAGKLTFITASRFNYRIAVRKMYSLSPYNNLKE